MSSGAEMTRSGYKEECSSSSSSFSQVGLNIINADNNKSCRKAQGSNLLRILDFWFTEDELLNAIL